MPDPALQTTALRYAARDLPPGEAAAFEGRLAADQDARDALGEAVRLSAAALGQAPPVPDRSFRAAIRDRLTGWCPPWLARRAYRGHPLAWAGLGAAAVVACAAVGLSLADPQPPRPAPLGVAAGPGHAQIDPVPPPPSGEGAVVTIDDPAGDGDGPSVAEVWAALSTPEHVEKAHDDEMRLRQKFRDAAAFPARAAADDRDP
jgi:hypothetical protein